MASLLAFGANAACNHRRNTIARSLAIDQLVEAEPPHGDTHGLHMPMRQIAQASRL
jgi:hypothetical protein